ncbi:MAG: endonuclease [Thermoanaerobaculia bacterium]|nr:endonuclease [Thermoanaerobaculia bacterium]
MPQIDRRSAANRVLSVLVLATALVVPPVDGQVINEFIVNHLGSDQYEFLEISGAPSTDYSDLVILELDGDSAGNPGLVESAHPVGSTDAEGIWWSGFLGDIFPTNDSLSFVLVSQWSGFVGQDLDSNDDGVFDVTPWTNLFDAVGVDDDDPSDRWYGGATVLSPNFDGVSFVPAGASRIPNGTDSESVADWLRNDFDGAGLPLGGVADPGEAVNTPGTENSASAAPPTAPALLSEVVADHSGPDSEEFVEIFGEPQTDYSTLTILVVEGDVGEGPGDIENVFPCGVTNVAGFWTTGPLTEEIEDLTDKSVLLVEGFSGAVGDDLDANDDGVIDGTPWTSLHDSVALSGGGGIAYSTAVISAASGASRVPWFVDTDSASDWWINDFDGAGFDGFPGSIESGEAYNTPERANRIHLADYYSSADDSSAAQLRATVHDIIDDHIKHPYSSSSFPDTWDILEAADEDPNDPNSILDVYKNESYAKFGGGVGDYNREHSWPRTYGFPNDGATVMPFTDCHHLFLSDVDYNSDRSSRAFDNCPLGCTEDWTIENDGVGGSPGTGYPGWSNWYGGSFNADGSWETWLDRRGDVARAQFYMDVRYEGGTHGETGSPEPDLILTDQRQLIVSTTSSPAYMGMLSVLLDWHEQDPVDAKELRRNDEIWKHQGNRNPFIDHPEWVACIFADVCDFEIFADGFESGTTSSWDVVAP